MFNILVSGIILVILISLYFIIYKKNNNLSEITQTPVKITAFGDFGKFSFDGDFDTKQAENDIKILKKVLKSAKTMSKYRKHYIKKLIKAIKNKKINFDGGLNYQKAINILNLTIDDICDIAEQNKEQIIHKIFNVKGEEPDKMTNKLFESAKNFGISEQDLKAYFSAMNAIVLNRQGFITEEQYNRIDLDYLRNCEVYDDKVVKKLSDELIKILTPEQKKILKNSFTDIKDLAATFIYWGENTIYRVSKINRFFDKLNENDMFTLIRIFKGIDDIDLNNRTIKKDANLQPKVKEFIPEDKDIKIFKNIKYINAYNNHDEIINALKHAEKRHIPVPKILVNFDLFSDLLVNKKLDRSSFEWINTAIKDFRIKEIYWVIPEIGTLTTNLRNYFLGYNDELDNAVFRGNYNPNLAYRNIKKPLTQRFLIHTDTAEIISESAGYTNSQINSYIKTGQYKTIKIHVCTTDNLPKIKKNFILSLDADFFANSGLTSGDFLENIPYHTTKNLNKFLKLWKTKMKKATIAGLSVSPEYIGFSLVGEIRGFYEYILKSVSLSKRK